MIADSNRELLVKELNSLPHGNLCCGGIIWAIGGKRAGVCQGVAVPTSLHNAHEACDSCHTIKAGWYEEFYRLCYEYREDF